MEPSEGWEEMEKRGETFWRKEMKWYKPGIGVPLLLIVTGVYWLGNEMGWWPAPFSIWPVLLIVFGAYWLFKALIYR